jgi:hypothetical protein
MSGNVRFLRKQYFRIQFGDILAKVLSKIFANTGKLLQSHFSGPTKINLRRITFVSALFAVCIVQYDVHKFLMDSGCNGRSVRVQKT